MKAESRCLKLFLAFDSLGSLGNWRRDFDVEGTWRRRVGLGPRSGMGRNYSAAEAQVLASVGRGAFWGVRAGLVPKHSSLE